MTRKDNGFTLAELLIVVAIVCIIAAISVPGLLRARMNANETSAITSLKITNLAQVAYSATCGNGGYAADYKVLGTPPSRGGTGYVDSNLGYSVMPEKSGYSFEMIAGRDTPPGPKDCNNMTTVKEYYANAVPRTNGTTGTRSFATNSKKTIWQLPGGKPPTEPFGAPAMSIK